MNKEDLLQRQAKLRQELASVDAQLGSDYEYSHTVYFKSSGLFTVLNEIQSAIDTDKVELDNVYLPDGTKCAGDEHLGAVVVIFRLKKDKWKQRGILYKLDQNPASLYKTLKPNTVKGSELTNEDIGKRLMVVATRSSQKEYIGENGVFERFQPNGSYGNMILLTGFNHFLYPETEFEVLYA